MSITIKAVPKKKRPKKYTFPEANTRAEITLWKIRVFDQADCMQCELSFDSQVRAQTTVLALCKQNYICIDMASHRSWTRDSFMKNGEWIGAVLCDH